MPSVILSREVLGQFESSNRRVEVLDENGRLRGFFVPVDDETTSSSEAVADSSMELPAGVVVPFDHEEIQRALAEPGGRSLSEILGDLRAHA